EAAENCLPFAKAERLRAALWIDARIAKACGGLRAANATDATQRSAKLLPAELEHGFDESEECVEIVHGHRGPFTHLEQHERGVDLRRWCERRCRDRNRDSCSGEHLH